MKARPHLAVSALALILAPASAASPGEPPPGYRLVWADEFDRDGLPDPTRWTADTEANAAGWYNHELQYYTKARPENARVAGGRLLIVARREALSSAPDYGGQRYTSARLTTRGKADWTYGFFEARARLPCGRGSWPAIWTLGAGHRHPDGGEIDIMEHVGSDPGQVHATIHNRATAGTNGDGASIALPTACNAFHRYQMTWTPERIVLSVDGRPIHTYRKAGRTAAGWPFDEPQYLLVNLAIGGDMAGPVDDAIFPLVYAIDYVRVYQWR